MPTAAKLISGLFFAVFGYLLANWLSQILPQQFHWADLRITMAVIGFLLGWINVGARAATSFRMAMSAAVTISVLLLGLTVFVSSFAIMIERGLAQRYRGLSAGLEDMLDVMAESVVAVLRGDVAVVILVAGAIGGVIAGLLARITR